MIDCINSINCIDSIDCINSIDSIDSIDCIDSIDQLIVLIRIALYRRSLAVVVWGASLGGLDLIRQRANIEALVQFDRSID